MTETDKQKMLTYLMQHYEAKKISDLFRGEADPEDMEKMLFKAADHGHMEIARVLLERGADVNGKSHLEMTPLMYAASNNHAEMVAFFIESGADVNAVNSWKMTALMYAAENGGGAEAIRVLLDNGADARLRNSRGDMAFHIAERGCRYDSAQLLEEALFHQHVESQHRDSREKQRLLKDKAKKPAIIRGARP